MESNTKVNVSEIIENSKVGGFQIGIGMLCGACLMIDGFDVQSMGYAAPALIKDWGIPSPTLGPVFSAGLFGILVGSLVFSTVADKIGRRPMLLIATLFFSLMTFWTARANSITELLVIRFIAGAGLGGIMPNALALTGEYMPSRLRVPAMMHVGNGFNFGAALGGFIAAWLIPNFGWRSVFYFGGAVPLVIAFLMFFFLPESLQFMVIQGQNPSKIRKWLKRVDMSAPTGERVQYVTREEKRSGVPVIHLFSEGRGPVTLLLWAVYFLNLLNLFLLSSWLPTLVSSAGYSGSTAVLAGAMLQAGGALGALAVAPIIGRVGLVGSLTVGFTMAAVCIALIGQPGTSLPFLFTVIFLAGWGILGGQVAMNALAGVYYPTYLRSTGVGWCLGIGRIGAIVGPLFAGELIRRQWPNNQLFLAAASFVVIAAAIMFSLRRLIRPEQKIPTDSVMAH
jgi:MFS transporter, AAHS family, 4-hydroxybenzoate transporter